MLQMNRILYKKYHLINSPHFPKPTTDDP